ncbi:head-tail connector protein [Kaistia sp. MMO-174]|uniref:head-tail connector protein n=1 Tax=Kaistia sp. MMO-174 TaxID=3081256 RepID=UPI00301B501D
MATYVVEAPAAVVTWAEAKAHLRLDGDDEQTYVETLIAAATAWIDGPSGWLGRAIGLQELVTVFDSFDDPLMLMAPVDPESVEIRYVDADGVEQALPSAAFRLSGPPSCPRVIAVHGVAFPSARCEADAIRVSYQAGYAKPPAPIMQAILLLVGQWFEAREAVNIGGTVNVLPFTVEALLSPYRVAR